MAWFDATRRTVVDPSPGEFSNWSCPSDLIANLAGPKSQGLINGLLQRLENGFLFAAAGAASWRGENNRLERRFQPVSIEPDWWQNADGVRQYSERLWTLGDCTCLIYDDDLGQFINVAFTAIRFEASGLYDTIPPQVATTVAHGDIAGLIIA